MVYTSELDRDLEAIAAYEKQKQEEEADHKQKIKEYFKATASSAWALKSNCDAVMKSHAAQKEKPDQDKSFIKEFK